MYDLSQVFDALFCDFESVFKTPTIQSGGEIYHAANFPPVNIYINEESKDLTFEFAVAGYNKEDMNITFEGDKMKLSINGIDNKKEGLKLLKKGFKTPSIETTFTVPVSKYRTGDAVADMKDGVLVINIPALEEIIPKQLLIY